MSVEENDLTPPTPSAGDYGQKMVKGAVSSIPVVGGLGGEFFDMIVRPPLAARQQRWMEQVASAIEELRMKNPSFNPAVLTNNETFISVVVQSTAAAVKTHELHKLEALRNAVQNVAEKSSEFEGEAELFMALVDRFTALHLKVLRFLLLKHGTVEEFSFLVDLDLADAAAADLCQAGLAVAAVRLTQQPSSYARAFGGDEGPGAFRYTYFRSLETFEQSGPIMYSAAAEVNPIGERFFRFISRSPKQLAT